MIVGIHKGLNGKFTDNLKRYETILKFNGIQHMRMDVSDIVFWENAASLDLFIYRWQHFHNDHQMGKTIIPILENEMKIKCFPNMATCWHYDDKIRQYYMLSRHGFPMIDSWVFWNMDAAIKWIESLAVFPLVFKLKGGAGSSNVALIRDASTAKKLVRKMFGQGISSGQLPHSLRTKDFSIYKEVRKLGSKLVKIFRGEDINPYWNIDKNYVYFQDFLPNNDYDTRVTIIGDRAFAFRRMNRDGDFRSSGSGVISYDMRKIDLRFIETAFTISKKFGFQSMAYDFVYGPDKEVKFCEMSYDYLDTTVFYCSGHWDARLNWHKGNLWPQFCLLTDALQGCEIRQPDINYQLPLGLKIV